MSLLVQKGLVTTIIPVYNRGQLVVEAVQSVLSQTYRPIEILVVDDGSTDETPDVLRQLVREHQEVKVFRQLNSGPGSARELGRLNCRGEYIQYLDSDDLLSPIKFELQIHALRSTPNAVIAYGKTEHHSLGMEPLGLASRRTGERHESMFPAFLRERWWFTSTPLYRRSIVEEAGPWTVLSNEEDWEYDCRIASMGGQLVFVDEFVSFHRSHDSHLSSDGATDPKKLRHRAMSRAKIYQHSQRYMALDEKLADIVAEDWIHFSKYAFLLARQCALVGLTTEARAMVSISIEAVGKKTVAHRIFLKLVKLFGWKRAAELIRATGR